MSAVAIHPAGPDDRAAVANVVDGAALTVADDTFERVLESGTVLVAETEAAGADVTPPVLGALVLDGDGILAVAVRPRRRGQGIGTALVEAAADRRSRLLARFDPRVRPFWESLDFAIEPADADGRLRGVRR